MRNLNELDTWRLRDEHIMQRFGTIGDHRCGAFLIPYNATWFVCMASDGYGWDHVSISHKTRTPRWGEMDYLKRRFFKDEEVVMQLHLPPSDHINIHPFCLHLWRPHDAAIPLPPKEFV